MRYAPFLVLGLAATALAATSSELDPTFGGDGIVVTEYPAYSWVNDIAVQPDGMVVSVGFYGNDGNPSRTFVARHMADGSVDEAFGVGGLVLLGGEVRDQGMAVAMDSAGSIYVAAQHRALKPAKGKTAPTQLPRFYAAKLRPNGTLDAQFGAGGIVELSVNDNDLSRAIAVDEALGRVYLAGGSSTGRKTGVDATIAALDMTTGAVLPAFGGDGVVTVAFSTGQDEIKDLEIDASHRIVFAGQAGGSTGDYSPLLGRFTPAGVLDTSFAGKGWLVETALDSYDWVMIGRQGTGGLALQPDGRIVLAGRLYEPATDFDAWLRRYDADGTVDTSFGTGGLARTGYAGEDQGGYVLVDADGSLFHLTSVVLTENSVDVDVDPAVWKFDPSGQVVWRSALVHEHPVGGWSNGTSIAFGAGSIVVGGSVSPEGDGAWQHSLLARILR